MHRLPPEQQLLVLLQAFALIVLTFRIWQTGLYSVYSYFFGYLLADVVQIVMLAVVPFDSVTYRNGWLITEAIIVCFYVLVVLELYSIVLQDLAGIATVSRRYLKVAVSLAIMVSLLMVGLERNYGKLVAHMLTFERALTFSLVLFILLIMLFLVYYPVPLKRNVLAYTIGYVAYFLTKATSIFIHNLGYYWNRVFSDTLIAASTACFLFWCFALTRRGETKTAVIGHQWNAADEERVLDQLKAINANLLRVARK